MEQVKQHEFSVIASVILPGFLMSFIFFNAET